MTDANFSRLTSTCGFAGTVLWLSQFPLAQEASVS
jgi:hypothetical protein